MENLNRWPDIVRSAVSAVQAHFGQQGTGPATSHASIATGAAPLTFGDAQEHRLVDGFRLSPSAAGSSTQRASADPLTSRGDGTVAVSGSNDGSTTLDVLFAQFNEMTLRSAFKKILPSVKRADDQAKYVALCLNIDAAAMALNYLLSVTCYPTRNMSDGQN